MTDTANYHLEVGAGERFEFGKNWARFLAKLDSDRIARSQAALQQFLGVASLNGRSFLDMGSGSGLSSLSARRLGARVCSVDFDPHSVACTRQLRKDFFPDDPNWQILEGSALDTSLPLKLGQFDIVYSWGVLHHTGHMWDAIGNALRFVAPSGQLFISIYNDQGRSSLIWLKVKRLYNALPRSLRFLVLAPCFARLWGPATIRDFLRFQPFHSWRSYRSRGMSPWDDVVDWVGGYPFEVAKPEQIFDFVRQAGYQLERMKTCAGGHGCNEFLFRKL